VLIITLVLLFVIGGTLAFADDGELIAIIAGFVLLIVVFVWSVNYITGIDDYNRHEAAKHTIESARLGEISDVERAALTAKIVDINVGIASAKYWNETFFGDMVYDKFAEADYLK